MLKHNSTNERRSTTRSYPPVFTDAISRGSETRETLAVYCGLSRPKPTCQQLINRAGHGLPMSLSVRRRVYSSQYQPKGAATAFSALLRQFLLRECMHPKF